MPVTKFVNNTKKVMEDIKEGTVFGVLRGSHVLAASIKKKTPVLTGELQGDIGPTGEVERNGNDISTAVFTGKVYGPAVEFGRPDQRGRKAWHMFEKGATSARQPVLAEIVRHLPK